MGPQEGAALDAARTSGRLAQEAYGTGIPALKAQQGFINEGLATGEPSYMKTAFGKQRISLTEGMFGTGQQGAMDAANKGAVQGGNFASILSPHDMGAKLAEQIMGSRTNEAMGNLEQTNKLLADAIGMGTTAGNAGVAAGRAQLEGIAGMPGYDSTYAAIVGAGNLGGAIYGQGKKSGWWGGAPPPGNATFAAGPGPTGGNMGAA